ncbi:alkaline phosphatase, partial [Vibrio vulnificus]
KMFHKWLEKRSQKQAASVESDLVAEPSEANTKVSKTTVPSVEPGSNIP